MDNLRICEVKGFNAPVDTIVTFFRVMKSERLFGVTERAFAKWQSTATLYTRWIRSGEYSFSLEVVHK